MESPDSAAGIVDISLRITPDMAIWPDDPRPALEPVATLERDGVQVSRLILSTHAGTHLDAPRHFLAAGRTVDQLDLSPLLGLCHVLDVTRPDRHISREDLQGFALQPNARVLLKTRHSHRPPAQRFTTDFPALALSAADHLCERGVQLVGIDGPSVDAWTATDFPCHKRLLAADILILENLVLWDVDPGIYGLIAVPLKLAGADGCPVRALLTAPRFFPGEHI
jgi:arylformamidase